MQVYNWILPTFVFTPGNTRNALREKIRRRVHHGDGEVVDVRNVGPSLKWFCSGLLGIDYRYLLFYANQLHATLTLWIWCHARADLAVCHHETLNGLFELLVNVNKARQCRHVTAQNYPVPSC